MKILPYVVLAHLLAMPVLATELSGSELRGSFADPINYRPHNGEGRLIVRAPGYSEDQRKIVTNANVGKTNEALPLNQSVTRPGHHSTGVLLLIEERD